MLLLSPAACCLTCSLRQDDGPDKDIPERAGDLSGRETSRRDADLNASYAT